MVRKLHHLPRHHLFSSISPSKTLAKQGFIDVHRELEKIKFFAKNTPILLLFTPVFFISRSPF
jgi:hypothetical protein